MNGIVVHAKQGQRGNYRAIKSKLCQTSEPLSVIDAFLSLNSFQTIYIADLDAIQEKGNNYATISKILRTFPNLRFWVDFGPLQNSLGFADSNWTPIFGSECLNTQSVSKLSHFRKTYILSMDFLQAGLLGPQELLATTHHWPEKIIVMSLSHVGSNVGPDLPRLEFFTRKWPNKAFIAAGGIRDQQDLIAIEALGIDTVLTASALHNGELA